MSATALVLPVGLELTIEPVDTVMTAAVRAGYSWPTVCGGLGTCHTCFCEVTEGRDVCSPIDDLEAEGLRSLGHATDGRWRLACQLAVGRGHVVVHRRGVKPRH